MESMDMDIMKNAAEKLAVEIDQVQRAKIINTALDQLALSIWKMEDELILAKDK